MNVCSNIKRFPVYTKSRTPPECALKLITIAKDRNSNATFEVSVLFSGGPSLDYQFSQNHDEQL